MSTHTDTARGTMTLLLLASMTALCLNAFGDTSGKNRGLDAYALSKGPSALAGVKDNLSGITWCGTTKTLFTVQNGPTQITELTSEGEVKRTIALAGFDDTEGIVWLGGSKFAVLEERRRQLTVFDIKPGTTRIARGAASAHTIEPKPQDKKKVNLGLEGVAFVPKANEIFICTEKSPRKVYRFKLTDSPKPTKAWDAQQNSFGLSDLAGLAYDEATGHLLLLSDESKAVGETTTDGREISRLRLTGDAALPQPEGVTIDDDGKVYVVSEPNLFCVFVKK